MKAMKNMTLTTPTPARRLLAPLAPVAVLAMALTGCGSTSSGIADGDYFGTYECVNCGIKNNSLVRLSIDEGSVAFDRIQCSGIEETDSSAGTLSEDGGSIMWTSSGDYSGSDTLIRSESGELLTLDDTAFSAESSDAGQTTVETFTQECEASADDGEWVNPLG